MPTTTIFVPNYDSDPDSIDSIKSLGLLLQQCLQPLATLARPYNNFVLDYASLSQEGEQQGQTQNMSYEHMLGAHGYSQAQSPYIIAQNHEYAITPEIPRTVNVLPSQLYAPDPVYDMGNQRLLPENVPHHVVTPPYRSPQVSMAITPSASSSRKRSRTEEPCLDHNAPYKSEVEVSQTNLDVPTSMASHGHSQSRSSSFSIRQARQMSQSTSPQPSLQLHNAQQHTTYFPFSAQPQMLQQQHHHHRLPNQPPPMKQARYGESSSPESEPGPPSVVGQEGMPLPAPRPKGPKLKFTREDDALLIELKETKSLTWRQIADFFPGRSSGTLQVRYCTKLKAKSNAWSSDMVQRLRNAMREYDNDRWRIISSKVGNGFSATACEAKADELEAEEHAHEHQENVQSEEEE